MPDILSKTLVVNEIFGPTIQGEGASCGWPAVFIRLWGCNLRCSWCDTKYSWNKDARASEAHLMTVGGILKRATPLLAKTVNGMIVITGGEPMLQKNLTHLVTALAQRHVRIEIETVGTIFPLKGTQPDQYNVSPKLANSGVPKPVRYKSDVLEAFTRTGFLKGITIFKFVVQGPENMKEVDELVDRHSLDPVYIMAEGTEPARLRSIQQKLVNRCVSSGYILSPRLHINLFGKERGI